MGSQKIKNGFITALTFTVTFAFLVLGLAPTSAIEEDQATGTNQASESETSESETSEPKTSEPKTSEQGNKGEKIDGPPEPEDKLTSDTHEDAKNPELFDDTDPLRRAEETEPDKGSLNGFGEVSEEIMIPAEITVQGRTIVIPAEKGPKFEFQGGASLITSANQIVKLAEGEEHEFYPDQALTVTLAVPVALQENLTADLSARVSSKTYLSNENLIDHIFDKALELGFELEVISVTKTPQLRAYSTGPGDDVAASQTSSTHTVDIVYFNLSGSNPSQDSINAMVKRLNDYWKRETNSQVANVQIGKIEYAPLGNMNACNIQDPYSLWANASTRLGIPFDINRSSQQGHHVMALTDASSCGGGAGLATLGASVHSGGYIWAAVDQNTLDWDGVVFHEFGHNLSLGHSGALVCEPPHNDSVKITKSGAPSNKNCSLDEYKDFYDVMGMGYKFTFNGALITKSRNVAALNLTQKTRIGALSASSIKKVNAGQGLKQTVKLKPISETSGVRGAEITDPLNGEKYFIEYRSGTGVDKDSMYAIWGERTGQTDLGPGVRVLRSTAEGSSVQLLRNSTLSEKQNSFNFFYDEQRPYVAKGTQFVSINNGFTISVTNMNGVEASVEITMHAQPKSIRVQGSDRFQTAIEVSKKAFPKKAPIVYLATGMNFPDALAAAPAAAVAGGPLLLLPPKTNQVSKNLLNRIKELDPEQVVVVGGTGAVSQAVLKKIQSALPKAKFKRIQGKDRYATGNAIVRYAFAKHKGGNVYLATGADFPDALSASAVAGGNGDPVVLVQGNKGFLESETKKLLKELRPDRVIIVGGTGVVSKGIENELSKSYQVKRLSGADRYSTSAAINKYSFNNKAVPAMYWATGTGFADALSGAVLAAVNEAPMFVVQPKCVPKPTLELMRSKQSTSITLIGGTGALSNRVAKFAPC